MKKIQMRGRVVLRLNLSEVSTDFCKKRRRKSADEEDGEGIVFVTKTADENEVVYLLITPEHLLKKVCDAIRFQQPVVLTRYTLLDFVQANSVSSGDEQTHDNTRILVAGMIELHEIISDTRKLSTPIPPTMNKALMKPSCCWDKALTLAQYRDHEHEANGIISIRATVDAISPIIAMVPSDPFALLLLVSRDDNPMANNHIDDNDDGDENTYGYLSCLVVLKGKSALQCHAGILPGDEIMLHQVRRQRWTFPQTFQKQQQKPIHFQIPYRVIVCTDAISISWKYKTTNHNDDQPCINNDKEVCHPSHMIQVEGILTNVVHDSFNSGGGCIQSIELILQSSTNTQTRHHISSSSQRRVRLLVSHLPISTNIIFGLRRGAMIRVMHIHPLLQDCELDIHYYGTCLRSTITILQAASSLSSSLHISSRKHDATFSAPRNNSTECTAVLWKPTIPWKYSRIRTTCLHQAMMMHVQQQLSTIQTETATGLVQAILSRQHHNGTCHQREFGKRRDPCAEFLDHDTTSCMRRRKDERSGITSSTTTTDDDTDTTFGPINVGCHMSSCTIMETELLIMQAPSIPTISRLFKSLNHKLKERFIKTTTWLKNDNGAEKLPSGGMVSSFQWTPNEIMSGPICLVGKVLRSKDGGIALLDASSKYICPITYAHDKKDEQPQLGQLVVCSLSVVIASALCLGYIDANNTSSLSTSLVSSRDVSLPSWTESMNTGSCTLIVTQGRIFMVSFHVHCESIVAVQENRTSKIAVATSMGAQTTTAMDVGKTYSVQEMLDPNTGVLPEHRFAGILFRHRFRFNRCKKGIFHGTILTLAHCSLPVRTLTESSLCATDMISRQQSLELKVAVTIPAHNKAVLEKAVQKLLRPDSGSSSASTFLLLEEQISMAAAWWCLADGSSSSALIACGMDEIHDAPHNGTTNVMTTTTNRFVPLLSVSTAALEHGNLGFLRFKCDLSAIHATLIKVHDIPVSGVPRSGLSALGGERFLPGMRNYIQRSKCSRYKGGAPVGVECVSLGDLRRKSCMEIRNGSHSHLAPSMVHFVRGAHFVAVTYCKVQVECAQCFQPLQMERGRLSGSASSGTSEQRSFWDVPLPLDGSEPKATTTTLAEHPRGLRCPNQCPPECAEVKWECSGLLDDGTGEAKMYAERDMAILLLKISPVVCRAIEAGAWEATEGLCYQKAMPPASYIKQAIREAQLSIKGESEKRASVLDLLSPSIRAAYLLHHSCITYRSREKNFFVRCKPHFGLHLNRTEIETLTSRGKSSDTVVYTLPPLKLNLVDMLPPD